MTLLQEIRMRILLRRGEKLEKKLNKISAEFFITERCIKYTKNQLKIAMEEIEAQNNE